jgi:hypothetical protein
MVLSRTFDHSSGVKFCLFAISASAGFGGQCVFACVEEHHGKGDECRFDRLLRASDEKMTPTQEMRARILAKTREKYARMAVSPIQTRTQVCEPNCP